MKIFLLKYGESVFGENYIFDGGNSENKLPISFVLYLIKTKDKNILVDAGCDDGAGFEMKVFEKPSNVLKSYNLSPDDITDVIITHAHHDHIAAVGHYNKAKIHIQRDEYEAGKNYIPENFDVNIFDDEFDVTDDVKIKKIGGHTKGSCIVLLKNYVFCGDECYVKKCLDEKTVTGSTFDKQKSQKLIDEYSSPKYTPLLFHDPDIMPGEIGVCEVL